jgi:hypothetical protein
VKLLLLAVKIAWYEGLEDGRRDWCSNNLQLPQSEAAILSVGLVVRLIALSLLETQLCAWCSVRPYQQCM